MVKKAKMMIYIVLFMLITVIMEPLELFAAETESSASTINSGNCGENVTWNLDSNYVLTISGTGKMTSYGDEFGVNGEYIGYIPVPWNNYLAQITEVVIKEGVTTVGSETFRNMSSLRTVSIPASIKSIESSFVGCGKLEHIYVAQENQNYCTIDEVLFDISSDLVRLIVYPTQKTAEFYEIPNGVVQIDSKAFYESTYLKTITFPESIVEIDDRAFPNVEEGLQLYFKGNAPKFNFSPSYYYEKMSVCFPTGNSTWEDASVVSKFPESTVWSEVEFEKKNLAECKLVFVDDNDQVVDKYFIDKEWDYSPVIYDGFSIVYDYSLTHEDYRIGYISFTAEAYESDRYTGTISVDVQMYDTWEDNLECTVDEEGTLYITGEGEMQDLLTEYAPWNKNNDVIASIKKVVVGEGITNLSVQAFLNMGYVKELELPSTLTEIERDAFSGCNALEAVNVPENVTKLGTGVFMGMDSLCEVSLPEGITEIPIACFEDCSSLFELNISDNVTVIGDRAFSGCYNLKVELPAKLERIGEEAYFGCYGKTEELYIPASVNEIGEGAFSNFVCNSFVVDDENDSFCVEDGILYDVLKTRVIASPSQKAGDCVLPNTVTTIDMGAFEKCNQLTSITIPDGVQMLRGYTFYRCTALENVVLSKNLKSIGYLAFNGCSNLTEINFPKGFTTIGPEALGNCPKLTKIEFPSSLEKIDQTPFYNCKGLKEVYFKGNAPEIANNAFTSVTANVYYPAANTSWNEANMLNYRGTLTWIPYDACVEGHLTEIANAKEASCSQTGYTGDEVCINCGETITAGESVPRLEHEYSVNYIDDENGKHYKQCVVCEKKTTLKDHSFTNGRCECGALEDNIIASGTCGTNVSWIIHANGFMKISGTGEMNDESAPGNVPWNEWDGLISEVVVEEGVTSIGSYAFTDCEKLKKVELPDSLKKIKSYAFCNCQVLEEIELPEKLSTLQWYAFSYCKSIKSLVIPETIKVIPRYTFEYCKALEKIEFKGSLTDIDQNAFYNCSALKEVYFCGNAPSYFNDRSFNGAHNVTAFYPETNSTWTSAVNKNYGGTIVWKSYDVCEKYDHSWNKWIVEVEPTLYGDGKETRTCQNCGDTEENTLAKLVAVAQVGKTLYQTLAEAVESAPVDGITIDILKNISEIITVPQDAKVILNLNGYTLSNVDDYDTITNYGELHICDGMVQVASVESTGAGKIINSNSEKCVINNCEGATLKVLGGTVENTSDGVAINNESKVRISAGCVLGNITDTENAETVVSGGMFNTDVSEYITEDSVIIKNADDNYQVTTGYTITATSGIKDNMSQTVANVSGGGVYQEGDTVSVVTSKVEGFTFLGWYLADNGGYTGEPLSTELSYGFEAYKSCSLIAVYEANGKATLTVNGTGFRVNNGSMQIGSGYRKNITLGTTVTLEYVGSEQFYYWKDSNGKIVSTQSSYAFVLTGDTTLTPVYMTANVSGYALVEFVSLYNQVLQASTYTADEDIEFATGPSKIGGTFIGWSVDGAKVADNQIIKDLILANNTHITLKPLYEMSEAVYTVTVIPDNQMGLAVYYENIQEASSYAVTAPEIEGKQFAYWSDSAGGEKVLSYGEKYAVLVRKDTVVYAIYTEDDDVIERIPIIEVVDAYTDIVDGAKKVSFIINRDVPKGYSLEEHGVIYSTSSAYGAEGAEEVFVHGGDGVKQYTSTAQAEYGNLVYSLSIGNKVDTVIYIRGYLKVYDSAGNLVTLYSDIYNASYNGLMN